MKFDTLAQWLNYIESLHVTSIDLGLSRIKPLAEKMNLTYFNCPVIIVGGTNGKGSCVKFLESIYSEANYRVAAYTSPHLFRFNERIRLAESEIDDVSLMQSFEAIEKERDKTPLSFFEFTTLAALHFFKINFPSIVILEVGLGGRLDAVNIVEPDVSIIATVDFDHCHWLGSTRESIGFEKAGIFRAKKPAIYGDLNPPQSLIQHANNLRSDLFLLNQDFQCTIFEDSWIWNSQRKIYKDLPLPILKIQNAASSLMAVELLQSRLAVDKKAIDEGIQKACLPGRFEFFNQPFPCIFDIAHNPQAARNLANALKDIAYSEKTLAVIGMLKDKLIADTVLPLIPFVDEWFVGDLWGERGEKAQNIIKHLRENQVKCFASIEEAMKAAIQAAFLLEKKARILVFGSFYTVAQAKKVWLDSSVIVEKTS